MECIGQNTILLAFMSKYCIEEHSQKKKDLKDLWFDHYRYQYESNAKCLNTDKRLADAKDKDLVQSSGIRLGFCTSFFDNIRVYNSLMESSE